MSRAFSPIGTEVVFEGLSVPSTTTVRITIAGLEVSAHYVPNDPAQLAVIESMQLHHNATLKVKLPRDFGYLTVQGMVTGEARLTYNEPATLTFHVAGLVKHFEGTCLCVVGCSVNGDCPIHGDNATPTKVANG